ncbi:ATP-binding cassette sub-family G member 1 isoform X1 [Solenopsis invicta]|uniref:ATP-binding cassette sub-family G member 1 isoform X1 n=2 Tax=Solenopsis invicta TaxID=13686 RepID=UPI00193C8927|nr:ATP-binding cassette sub-family G member 1 isoform X1 [Solenopsis invicta]
MLRKMPESNTKNNAATMLDNECKIELQESKQLLEAEKWKSKMYIQFNDLSYSVRNRKGAEKTILHNVTGHFESGKFTVIIGPSGAGKTTLMKIISGKQPLDVKGTITINDVKWNRAMFRKHVCYVPQHFDLLPFLTTSETLYIAARLQLDGNQNKQEINSIVNNIAENLWLSNCLDTLVIKLSGGERRRLSIGVQIISKSSVFLLDEPTSGLDSAASYQLISILHNMTKANCAVVCAIHQPSGRMISLFDDIMVLNRGKCMYCGPKSEILSTYNIAGFTRPSFYNIAEFVLEVITEQKDEDLKNLHKICRDEYEKFKSRSTYKSKQNSSIDFEQNFETDNTVTSTKIRRPEKSTWQQQKILCSRALICIMRDNTFTKLRIAAHITAGLLFGLIFYNFGDDAIKVQSNISCLFIVQMYLFIINALQTVQMIPTEAKVFLQEHLNNWYSFKAYYSVKVLTDIPVQILCTTSFLLITYYMTGQPMVFNRIIQVWSICLLTVILGQTFGIFIGTAFGTKLGVFLIPGINIPLMILAGFFVKITELPMYIKPLTFLSYYRYMFEGTLQAIYLDRPNLSCSEIYCYFSSTNKILSTMDLPTMPFYVILIILSSWIFCFHIIVYAVFHWKLYYAKK